MATPSHSYAMALKLGEHLSSLAVWFMVHVGEHTNKNHDMAVASTRYSGWGVDVVFLPRALPMANPPHRVTCMHVSRARLKPAPHPVRERRQVKSALSSRCLTRGTKTDACDPILARSARPGPGIRLAHRCPQLRARLRKRRALRASSAGRLSCCSPQERTRRASAASAATHGCSPCSVSAAVNTAGTSPLSSVRLESELTGGCAHKLMRQAVAPYFCRSTTPGFELRR